MSEALSDVEREAAALLERDAMGDIDNVFEIVEQLLDLHGRLPRGSTLRPRFDEFVARCQDAMAGGA